MKKVIICLASALLASSALLAQRPNVTVSVDLPGRATVGMVPWPDARNPVSGVIIVDITVDPYGNVLTAVPGSVGTSVSDNTLLTSAKRAAIETHFNTSADAPAKQQGTITYLFASSLLQEIDEKAFAFMGVPIDGSRYQMVTALEAKGFEREYSDDQMTGMFNGEKVALDISTNHGIVDRVLVIYPRCEAANDTRIKYNTLLSRFNRNPKYVCINPRNDLSADEEIFWNINANSKYYDAVFFSLNPGVSSEQWVASFKNEYQKLYNKQLGSLSYEEMEEALFCLPNNVSEAINGVVWFTMVDPYHINISYINFKNRPRGEDL